MNSTNTRFKAALLFMMLVASCKEKDVGWDSSEVGFVTLEKTSTIGREEGTFFIGRVADILALDSGELYIADDKSHQIIKLDNQGVVERRVGDQGGGPGEFLSGPDHLALNGKYIAALEEKMMNPRVHIYDRHLNFIKTITLGNDVRSGFGIYFNHAGKLVLPASSDPSRNKGKLINVDIESEEVSDYVEVPLPSKNSLWNSAIISSVEGENNIVAFRFVNNVKIIDSAGIIVASFSIDGLPARADSIVVEGSPPADVLEQYPHFAYHTSYATTFLFSAVTVDEINKYILIRGARDSDDHRQVYVYDYDGEYQLAFSLPQDLGKSVFYVTPDGYLLLDEEEVIINKYKITYRNDKTISTGL